MEMRWSIHLWSMEVRWSIHVMVNGGEVVHPFTVHGGEWSIHVMVNGGEMVHPFYGAWR
jgi:hypothetical protein